MKLHIVGIDKCGTVSLMKYLQDQGHEVIRDESMYWDGGPKAHFEKYPDHQVIFILRDPVERTWSNYWYKRYHQKGDRLEIKEDFDIIKNTHPELFDHSDYQKWLDIWRETNPIISWLESYQRYAPGFPLLNSSPDKQPPTQEQINYIKERLGVKL